MNTVRPGRRSGELRGLKRALWLLPTLIPGLASAHPVDEVVQGAYLTVAPGQLRLELDLTPGTEVAGAVLKRLDANGDRRISDAEARAFGERVLRQSTLTVDGKAAAWRLERVDTPSYADLEQSTPTLKIYATATRPDRAAPQAFSYENRYQPAKSQWIANVFLQPGGGGRYRVIGQQHTGDGRGLTVNYAASR